MTSDSDDWDLAVEEILLRLDDAADLVRASAACTSFHRVVSSGRFQRRFRSLHRPPVLGFIDCHGWGLKFFPTAGPPPRCRAARALARAADFSSSFLRLPAKYWKVSDVRDGRILFSRRNAHFSWYDWWYVFEPMVIYDPLHRLHVEIPCIPSDLMPYNGLGSWLELEAFLLPPPAPAAAAANDRDDDPSSFQVMCNVLSENGGSESTVSTFIYSSATRTWRGVASFSNAFYDPVKWLIFSQRHYARGCFYWMFKPERAMVILDTHEMKFSVVNLPTGSERQDKIIVQVAEQDRVGLLILGEHTLDLYSKKKMASCSRDIISSDGDDDGDWRHDNGIPLFPGYESWSLNGVAAAEGYALLRGVPQKEYYQFWGRKYFGKKPTSNARYFTVEIKTLLVEQLCILESSTKPNFLYASFPPPFAPPTISHDDLLGLK